MIVDLKASWKALRGTLVTMIFTTGDIFLALFTGYNELGNIICQKVDKLKVKLGFYILFNSHSHIETDSQLCHLYDCLKLEECKVNHCVNDGH